LIFGTYHVAETFFGFIFWFIPYWSWIRLGLFVWLLLPQFNGSKVVYDSVLAPFIRENKDLIQSLIAKAKKASSSAAAQAMKEATDPQNITRAMKIGFEAQEKLHEATNSVE
jgi:receptor expression-enhancing protein 1/2/3/4